jgi:D-alanyl-D-alanine carboxypeptidase
MIKEIKIFIIFLFLLLIAHNIGHIYYPILKKEIKYTNLFFIGQTPLINDFWQLVDENLNNNFTNIFENLNQIEESDPIKKIADDNLLSDRKTEQLFLNISKKEILLKARINGNENRIKPLIIENQGVKLGFLNIPKIEIKHPVINKTSLEILLMNEKIIKELINTTKKDSDLLIISFHWDDKNIYSNTNNKENFIKSILESGADIIIFYYPKTIENFQVNKDSLPDHITDFLFDQYFKNKNIYNDSFSISFNADNLKEIDKKIYNLNQKFKDKNKKKIITPTSTSTKYTFSCPKPNKKYPNFYLVNVGQNISLPDPTYIPDNLLELDMNSSTKKNLCLTKEAKEAFELMTKKAKEAGLIIKAHSAYRSYETQKIIFQNGLKNNPENTLIAIAKPGHSEHQLGTTIDLTGSSINFAPTSVKLENSVEGLWLSDNAHLYGFVLSYPKNKEHITGYKYEPWHYRYLGVEIATKIKNSNLTITEFLY